jgi:hypothetical protein
VRRGRFLPGFDATTHDTTVYVRYVEATPLADVSDTSVVEVLWGEPPDDARVGKSRDMQVRDQRLARLGAIANQPGEWALFDQLGTPASARNLAARVRSGAYAPGFDATVRGSKVYVRFVGL